MDDQPAAAPPPPRSLHRRILALALPATLALAADPLMGLVDTAVLGRVGAAELGALGLALAVLATVSWVCSFLVFGTTSTVARAVGAGDLAAAGRRVSHAAQVAVGLGAVIGVGLLVAAPLLLRVLGAAPELIEPGTTYLRIRAVGVPLLLLGYVGHGAFRGVADTRTPLLIVVVAKLANAGLTLWLVLGLGWGVAGAAWGTVVAEAVVVALLVGLRGRTRLPLAGHGRPDRAQLRALAVVSRDLVLRTGGLLLGLLAITAAASRIGVVTAAAHQVLFQVLLLGSFLMDGVAIAGQTLIGAALGRERPDEARQVAWTVTAWGVVGGAAFALVLLVGASAVPRALTDADDVLAVVATAWWLLVVGQVVAGPVYALDGVLMGAEDYAFLRSSTVAAAAVGGVGGQLVAAGGGGLTGLWWAVLAMLTVRAAAVGLRLRGGRWLRTGAGLPGADAGR